MPAETREQCARWSTTTDAGNTLSVFFNRETGLFVVDLVSADESGGCEIVRMGITDEAALLSHCGA